MEEQRRRISGDLHNFGHFTKYNSGDKMNVWKGRTCRTSEGIKKCEKINKKPEEKTAPGGRKCKRGSIILNNKEMWTEELDWIQVA
jgi:hypothetical protein